MAVYSVTIRNRAVAALVGLVVLGAGAALLVVGLALLAGVAIAGGLLGTGILAYRKLRGQPTFPAEQYRAETLDPSLEVFPDHQPLARPSDPSTPNDDRPRIPPA